MEHWSYNIFFKDYLPDFKSQYIVDFCINLTQKQKKQGILQHFLTWSPKFVEYDMKQLLHVYVS